MGPTNEHELAIARIVDRIATEGTLSPTAIEDVIAVLNFTMTKSDSEFLVNYISMANGQPDRSIARDTGAGATLEVHRWPATDHCATWIGRCSSLR